MEKLERKGGGEKVEKVVGRWWKEFTGFPGGLGVVMEILADTKAMVAK